MDKTNLHNPDIERGIIANIVLRNEIYDDVVDKLFVKDFFDSRHKIIIEAIISLSEQAKNFDIFILSEYLSSKKLLDKAGGENYLVDIVSNSVSVSNIEAYLDILGKKSIKRELSNILLESNQLIQNTNDDIENEILAKVEEKILSIRNNSANSNSDFITPNNIIADVITNLENASSNNGVQGLSTGFKSLDKKLGGMREEQLIVIAGRPGMGKTTFAMNIAENVLNNSDKSVLLFSMEMSARDIMERMISSYGLLDFTKLRQANFAFQDWGELARIGSALKNKKLTIVDKPALTPQELKHKARNFKRFNPDLGLIVVDYLQLMQCPMYQNNRNLEVSRISNELKALAKELKIPVVVISQLNRAVDSRNEKRPFMSDLRDSGSIEQDADIILFVYREEVYNEANNAAKGQAEIIIAKHRNGETGSIGFTFKGEYCKFLEKTFYL
ncbi:replicative DNA helicase [Francisella sp. TX07-6608]|uniref:replicative DNA helicase n=1 Tax=Francisella sp. TX07-6608 TaxID=573568 RepID=UPI0008F9E1F4|nr:replicative DNA helicase [Francisella sp. TX07-6608]OIN82974.1 replicative DNA helicase [Francisella sp. TX07-6608]